MQNANGKVQGPGVPTARATLGVKLSQHMLPTQNTFLNSTVQFC